MQTPLENSPRAKAAEQRALWRAAATLERQGGHGKRRRHIPTVFFFTDPQRTPDPLACVERLPAGAGVVFRGFGAPDSEAAARSLLMAAKRRRLVFLVGADEKLAQRVGAMGLHLPERALWRARGVRRRHPNWLVTGSAHSPTALARAARCNLDAIFLSSIFPSRSPSAGPPIGPLRLFLQARLTGVRPHALGGVDGQTALRLIGGPVRGFAAVEALT